MKTNLEKQTTKAMSMKIAKLMNLAKRKKVKENPVMLKQIMDSITDLKESRLTLRKEEESKNLIAELKNKDFRDQLISKTTLLRKTPSLTEILNKYKS
jgi:chromosome condensin MukBEF complex kleisin-like MukF subunit